MGYPAFLFFWRIYISRIFRETCAWIPLKASFDICKNIASKTAFAYFHPYTTWARAEKTVGWDGATETWVSLLLFYQAGTMFGIQEWIEEGRQIALHTTKRRTPEETLVIDGGFCHGHAGIAHIYARLYEYYQYPAFQSATEYWLTELQQFVEAQGGIMNYQEHRGEAGWYACDSLLGGSAGIALVLLNQYSKVEPAWDRMFLLS